MFEKSISWLFILIIPALVTGPFLPDLFVSLLAISFFWISYHNNIWSWLRHPIILIIIFFWLYACLRSLFSDDPLFSLESSLLYIRFLLFSLTVCFLWQNIERLKFYFASVIFLTVFIVSLDAYIQYFFGVNLIGIELSNPHRINGFFRDEYIIGSFISRLLPLLLYFVTIYVSFEKKLRIDIIFLIIFLFVAVLLSGERAAFFYAAATIFSLVFLNQKLRKTLIYVISLSIAAIVLLLITLPDLKQRMVNQTFNEFGFNSNSKNLAIFTPIHQDHYKSAYLMFLDNKIFGQGPKMFRVKCFEDQFNPQGCTNHPHNTYMQLLAELGIVGAIPVILIFIWILFFLFSRFFNLYFFSNSKSFNNDETICLIVCFTISLWPFIPTGSFFNNWLNVIYYIPIGIYLSHLDYFRKSKL